ncbi:hypothetical protein GCM10010508_41900 [Streptomyces naganishii JCM 4654]|uniref:Uncharacterized protein n=1 Tax=Streptomyces naganishii JCM 4654 TaxID=1306179 RepID=A0A918Y6M6_9ACTN|nr:hypothetical protein GCM10010508_41900 [Streptomyces naganishii JCM 4654]
MHLTPGRPVLGHLVPGRPAPGYTCDPAVVTAGSGAKRRQAAELPAELVEEDDEPESDDDEVEDDEELDGFDEAGLLLEEEPRLSLR